MMIRRKYGRYYFIYKIINLLNNKIYVGKRITDNLNDGYLGSGKLIKRAIEKYGQKNFYREILEFCQDKQQLNEREIYWIKELNSRKPEIGYNIGKGGDGGQIEHHTEETKQILREKNLGRKDSPETCKKKSDALRIRVVTWGDKISKSLIGKKQSEDHRNKNSKGHIGQLAWNKDKNMTKASCKKMSDSRKLYYEKHPEVREKIGEEKRIWFKTPEGKEFKQRNLLGENNPTKKPEVEERRKKSLKGRVVWNKGLTKETDERVKVNTGIELQTCPHCGLQSTNIGAMDRWHFDNCKYNPNKNIVNTESKTG